MPLHHHFVPHNYPPVKPQLRPFDSAQGFDGQAGDIHHRAHLISTKSLFVYFQLLLIFGVFTFFFKPKSGQILGTVTFSPAQIVALSNSERLRNGLSALAENPLLQKAAEEKASDMIANDYWAHYSPAGKAPWGFITGAGYKYVYAGENLARDFEDAGEVVQAWMNSPSHRANLLDRNFREIGVAVRDGKLGGRDGILVVQMFGASAVIAPESVPFSAEEKIGQSPVQGEQVNAETIVAPQPGLIPVRFDLARTVSLVLVSFIFLLFLIEAIVSIKSAHMKLQRQVIAHLLLLGLSIIALWYSANGAIL